MTTLGQVAGNHILAVSAHRDDVGFTIGSLGRWTNLGWTVSLVVSTDGEIRRMVQKAKFRRVEVEQVDPGLVLVIGEAKS
jgi:LmbE family N-acetylglucosaminyl deacetylase